MERTIAQNASTIRVRRVLIVTNVKTVVRVALATAKNVIVSVATGGHLTRQADVPAFFY